jgi:hypothetical protein
MAVAEIMEANLGKAQATNQPCAVEPAGTQRYFFARPPGSP